MTREVVCDLDGVAVLRDGSAWFIRYDAGAHQIAMREDGISAEEAALAMSGPEGAVEVLFALQQRLIAAGINPYAANAPE
ncbi:hypothetical protein NSE01_18180 [Novosphingobium sediminis]|uniref:Uncharacterized protein n=1 Tax=Novosphingobium sediminis TaxID=707214 RepID=A0A512AJW9_9SPHN|nr:hypothetical protein [Novosphingobium sediminis]GEN99985.1 hypothetical protein NSE01_18180 [Novosphingobium sediminis]